MATITKRGEYQWRAQVRVRGFPAQTRTFNYKADAETWARATERELETSGFIDRREAERTTLRQVLERYGKEVSPNKKGATAEAARIRVLLRDPVLPKLKMAALSSAALAAWRDRRLQAVQSSTLLREKGVLSAAINHARREWKIHIENPVELVKWPAPTRARERRITAEEEAFLLEQLALPQRNEGGVLLPGPARNPWFGPLFQLATATAMRRSELLALTWENVDLKKQVATLPDTKNGDRRRVPLSTAAVAIFKALPGGVKKEGRVILTTEDAVKKGVPRLIERARARYVAECTTAGMKPAPSFLVDVHFHDTRHEATSRLAEKLSNVLELSAVTGHRDLRSLKRYYHPRAEDLAKKLD